MVEVLWQEDDVTRVLCALEVVELQHSVVTLATAVATSAADAAAAAATACSTAPSSSGGVCARGLRNGAGVYLVEEGVRRHAGHLHRGCLTEHRPPARECMHACVRACVSACVRA